MSLCAQEHQCEKKKQRCCGDLMGSVRTRKNGGEQPREGEGVSE